MVVITINIFKKRHLFKQSLTIHIRILGIFFEHEKYLVERSSNNLSTKGGTKFAHAKTICLEIYFPKCTVFNIFSFQIKRRMGGVQPSKLLDSNIITGLSYLEDGQFAKIYKVRHHKIYILLYFCC